MREKILTFIEKNSRIDLKELAIILGVDEAAVVNELQKMEEEHIICGYHTLIDWDKAGIEKVTALIEVRVTPQRGMGFDKVAERIYNYPEVNSVYLISGGFDFMVTIEGKTLREVSQFVSDKLSPLDSVLSTKTNFILKKYKDHGTVMAEPAKDERIEDAISLGVGEPDFDTPWHIRDEGIYSLEKGKTHYTSNAGLKELKTEIDRYLNRHYGVSYDVDHEIMVTIGGSEAIDAAMRAMLDPGDEVLIPQPSYVSYVPCAVLAGAVPVVIELKAENEFRLTAEELEAAITPKTKLLVLPFPNNPTGAIMERSDLEKIAEVIGKAVPVEIVARHKQQVTVQQNDHPDVAQYNELILKTVRSRPCTAEDLVSALGIPADRIEPHLRRMERAGLVISEEGTRGKFYRPA